MSALTWTREKPTVSGWYWLHNGSWLGICEVWEHHAHDGTILRIRPAGEPIIRLEFFQAPEAWWMGPLPIPPEPQP